MGRKKKKVMKPWCWYCNREFDDEKILIQHQKAKHFKCHVCHKKLYTGPGLAIHCLQVHKETIDRVPNSVSNRGSLEIEIYGMEGIPEEDQKKWEAQKLGKDDEPSEKQQRMDFAAPGAAGFVPSGPMGQMMPGAVMQMPSYATSMMPGGMGSMAPNASAVFTSPRPLGPPGAPTFPAYGAPVVTGVASGAVMATGVAKSASVVSQGTGTKIVHPEDDRSLEERRASFPRYAAALRGNLRKAGSMGRAGPDSSLMAMSGVYPSMAQASTSYAPMNSANQRFAYPGRPA